MPNDPLIGQRVGNYVITAPLQEGGMSTVYVAEHPEIGRRVAVKVVSAALSDQAEAVERFLAEARAISRLDHPNIITIYDYGRMERGQLYYVMELLRGRELAALMAERGPMRSQVVGPYLQHVCAALQAAHDHGIVHRDLKPENVFVLDREPLALKLLDFGIAKIEGRDGAKSLNLTATGMVMGTPFTIAPEQAAGRPDLITPRTDIYSLGAVLYWMLAGHPPFSSEATALVLAQHIRDPPPPLARVAPHVGPAVAALVERCLAKAPAQRPASATELSTAFGVATELDARAAAVVSASESASASSEALPLAATVAETRVRQRSLPAGARRSGALAPPVDDSAPTDRGVRLATESGSASALSAASAALALHDTDSQSWDATEGSYGLPATRRVVRPPVVTGRRGPLWAWVGGAALVLLAAVTAWVWVAAAPPRAPGGDSVPAPARPAAVAAAPAPAPAAAVAALRDAVASSGLRTIEITALDFEGRCRLRVEGVRLVEQRLPCQLQVSSGQEVELEVLRPGFAAFRRRWSVARDERLVLRALSAAQRVVEVGAPSVGTSAPGATDDADSLWPEEDLGLPTPRPPSVRRAPAGAGRGARPLAPTPASPRRRPGADEEPPLLGEDTAAF